MSNLPNDPLLNISINSFAKKLRKGEINCEQIVTSYLNRIKALNDKLNAFIFIDEKKAIETGIADLKESLKGADVEDIKKKTQNLIQVSMKLGEAVYKSQQKNQSNDDKNDKDPKDKSNDKENVVDADFEDVKENKEKSA